MRRKLPYIVLAILLFLCVLSTVRLYVIYGEYRSEAGEFDRLIQEYTVRQDTPAEHPTAAPLVCLDECTRADVRVPGNTGTQDSAETGPVAAPEQPENPSPDARATALQPPIQVDFEALTARNPDSVGWILVEGTNVSYPVMQAPNSNSYYLNHTMDGKVSKSGSIFMDCYCKSGDELSANTIIYGHNMKDGSMFYCLKDLLKQEDWEHTLSMWFLTGKDSYRILPYAALAVKPGSWMYHIDFSTPEVRQEYIDRVVENAEILGTERPGEGDLLITLSTCSQVFHDARYVIQGILVPSIPVNS